METFYTVDIVLIIAMSESVDENSSCAAWYSWNIPNENENPGKTLVQLNNLTEES
jgi:hypothetical protein